MKNVKHPVTFTVNEDVPNVARWQSYTRCKMTELYPLQGDRAIPPPTESSIDNAESGPEDFSNHTCFGFFFWIFRRIFISGLQQDCDTLRVYPPDHIILYFVFKYDILAFATPVTRLLEKFRKKFRTSFFDSKNAKKLEFFRF